MVRKKSKYVRSKGRLPAVRLIFGYGIPEPSLQQPVNAQIAEHRSNRFKIFIANQSRWCCKYGFFIAGNTVQPYELPYSSDVRGDPDINQMREVVVTQKKRPSVANQWTTSQVMLLL